MDNTQKLFLGKEILGIKTIITISILIFIAYILRLFDIVNNITQFNFAMSDLLRLLNFDIAAMSMLSGMLCYTINKKEEIFLISLVYMVFVINIYLNQNYAFECCTSVSSSITIIGLLFVCIKSEDSKVRKFIIDNKKYFAIFILSMTSILTYIEYSNSLLKIHEQLELIKLFSFIKFFMYINLSFVFFRRSIRKKEYIYAVIATSSLMFALKEVYSISNYIYRIQEINTTSISITYASFIVFSLGLIVELMQSININKDLDEKQNLFYNIFEENKYSNILVCDMNNNLIYANKKFIVDNKYIIDRYKSINDINIDDIKALNDKENINKCLNNDKYYETILELNGGEYIYDVSIQKFVQNKKTFKIIEYRDITERHKMKEHLLELDNMKKEEQMKNEFFANVSHELKTPLNIIYSTIQLLDVSTNKENFKEIYSKYRKTIDINCKRILRLVDNIVDITKLEVGYSSFNYKNFDIVRLVEEMTLSVVNYAKCKNISIIFDTYVEELNIKIDVFVIERIMLNVLSNAIKFTNEGGEIIVKISHDDEYVNISVKDDGIGISKDLQENIFDRFVQGDKSLRRENEGSGIGLSLVKHLIVALGGKIEVHSDGVSGTEFVVSLKNEVCDECRYKVDYEVYEEKIKLELSDIYEVYDVYKVGTNI